MSDRRKKIRVSFQKNREKGGRRERSDFTRYVQENEDAADLASSRERVRAKGEASRKRTILVDEATDQIAIDESQCLRGRVLSVQGLYCFVVTDSGEGHRCYIRRLLKSIDSDSRSVVTVGDWVWFKPAPDHEGVVARVEPRQRLLTRQYRHQEHIIAANIDQILIVTSYVEPELKPNLIDRYLVSAAQGGLDAIICVNKCDLAQTWHAQPIFGIYSQLGHTILSTSAATGQGMDSLRQALSNRETAVVGQSGVGKSSLLNRLEPSLHLKVGEISETTHKGRHTTTTSQLLRLSQGGTVIDTPGIRQFELWDLSSGELEAFFLEFRPFIPLCQFPDCVHVEEVGCAIKQAVADNMIAMSRYESYLKILAGDGG